MMKEGVYSAREELMLVDITRDLAEVLGLPY